MAKKVMKKMTEIDPTLPADLQKKRLLRTNPKRLTDKSQHDLREKVISAKKEALIGALKQPPSLNQFNKYIDEQNFEEIFELFHSYAPETRKQRTERIEKENNFGRTGEKPIIVKSGIRHVTDLVERKEAKLVLIACDVDPIEVVLFLPTLCKKMNVPYALVRSKYDLGRIVNRKKTATVCLTNVKSDKKTKFQSIIKKCNGLFSENYETTMSTWGEPKRKEIIEE